jgi:hypothetical protein
LEGLEGITDGYFGGCLLDDGWRLLAYLLGVRVLVARVRVLSGVYYSLNDWFVEDNSVAEKGLTANNCTYQKYNSITINYIKPGKYQLKPQDCWS